MSDPARTAAHDGDPADAMRRRVLDALDIAVFCYDPEDRLACWNRAAELLFPAAAVPRAGLERTEHLRMLRAAGVPLPALPGDGEQEWEPRPGCRLRSRARRLPDGSLLVEHAEVTRDRTAEPRFAAVMAALPVGVAVAEPGGRIVARNPALDALYAPDSPPEGGPQTMDALHAAALSGADEPSRAAMMNALAAVARGDQRQARVELRTGSRVVDARWTRLDDGTTVTVHQDISELRLAERRLRSAVDAMTSSIFLWSRDRRLMLWNRLAEEMFPAARPLLRPGISYEELNRAFVAAGYITGDRAWAADPREPGTSYRVLDDDRVLQVQRIATPDGGFLVTHTDVTELRRAQQRLVDGLSAIGESFALFDAARRLVIWNGEFEKELGPLAAFLKPGLRYDTLMEHAWDLGLADASPGVERAAWVAHCVSRRMTGGGITFDRVSGGRTYRVAKHLTVEGGVVRVAVDITELVWQRREIQRLGEAEVAKRMRLLQVVIDSTPVGLAVFDGARTLVLWNTVLAGLVGSAGPAADDGPRTLDAILDRIGVAGAGRGIVLRADSRDVEVVAGAAHLSVRLIATQDMLVLAITDITAIRREQEERLGLQRRLLQMQKIEALGTVSSTVAHDFNNVLAVILGFALMSRSQLAQLPADLPEAVGRFHASVGRALDNIARSAARGREIVESLAQYRRREGVSFALEDVGRLATDLARLVQVTVPASVRFTLAVGDAPLVARVNSGQLEQALMNLCLNAAQALGDRPGCIAVRVRRMLVDGRRAADLRAAGLANGRERQILRVDAAGVAELWVGLLETGPHVEIAVEDDGVGMDARTLGCIFDSFFTTRSSGGGSGLGLVSVGNIVAAHGGAIHVRSRQPGGTVFTIVLPAAGAAGEREEGGPGEPAAAPAAPAMRVDTRVMVVDDDPGVLEFMGDLLRDEGFEVVAIAEPARALRELRAAPHDYDLVISDQTMPELTGRMLAEAIAELRPDLPVLIMTGYSAEAIAPGTAAGVVRAVLEKPGKPRDILAAVRAIMATGDG